MPSPPWRSSSSPAGFVSSNLSKFVKRFSDVIDGSIVHDRDNMFSYFGFKTLMRSYLLKDLVTNKVLERPQYMWMRVALGIHCADVEDVDAADESVLLSKLDDALETYEMMSRGYFTHASPTLFHAGTTHPQMSSCFLVEMTDDSIDGIYDTLKKCAVISKGAGGIGLSVHNISRLSTACG